MVAVPMRFPLLPIVRFTSTYGDGFLTDHNRQELSVSYDEIGNTGRTVRGTLRGYVIARKRSFSLSWDTVPADAPATVDGFWSGNELLDFYNNNFGTFTMSVYNRSNVINANAPLAQIECRLKDFSYDVLKRGVKLPSGINTDFSNFNCSWEEV